MCNEVAGFVVNQLLVLRVKTLDQDLVLVQCIFNALDDVIR